MTRHLFSKPHKRIIKASMTHYRFTLQAPLESLPLLEETPSALLQTPAGELEAIVHQDNLQDFLVQLEVIKALFPISWSQEELAQRDWLKEHDKALPPIEIAGIRIVKSEEEEGLAIEASIAFGSGHHETTSGCLIAMRAAHNERSFARTLDMGCGSGILALAARLMGSESVVAVDNDPDALHITRKNARTNCLDIDIREDVVGQFDLIIANIQANVLIEMAEFLQSHLQPGGQLILSGILQTQKEAVSQAYRLKPIQALPMAEWVTLRLA